VLTTEGTVDVIDGAPLAFALDGVRPNSTMSSRKVVSFVLPKDADQGTQYESDPRHRLCRSNHLQPSMSRKGNCWDNAVAESFFGSLKKERVKKLSYRNRELARNDIADYIETFYNRTRRHSHPGNLGPEQFEMAHWSRRRGVHQMPGTPG
jgi:hypothetical protein